MAKFISVRSRLSNNYCSLLREFLVKYKISVFNCENHGVQALLNIMSNKFLLTCPAFILFLSRNVKRN